MARVPTEEITAQRFEGWAKRLSEAHATPLMVVGVRHDEHVGGRIVISVEDVPDADLALLLRWAAYTIAERQYRGPVRPN